MPGTRPPALDAGGYSFNALDGFVYNIFTNFAYQCNTVCSGRVLDKAGVPVPHATLTASTRTKVEQTVTTNARGIYAFILPMGSRGTTYTFKAAFRDQSASRSVTVKGCFTTSTTPDGMYYPSTGSVANQCDLNITLAGLDLSKKLPTELRVR